MLSAWRKIPKGYTIIHYSKAWKPEQKLISIMNLDKAKVNFEKVLVKEPESRMANIGLAAVYAVDKYSGKDYFKAFAYFQKAYDAKPQFTADDKEVLNELFTRQDKRRKNQTCQIKTWTGNINTSKTS